MKLTIKNLKSKIKNQKSNASTSFTQPWATAQQPSKIKNMKINLVKWRLMLLTFPITVVVVLLK
ncbi:MAG: hypothetical protein WBP41_07895, partial [Saprospiraceae bacterium]